MTLPLVEFWQRLLHSGLADAETPRLWAAGYAQDHQGTPIDNVVSLSDWAVKTGRLTAWQAEQLVAAAAPNLPRLRIGSLTHGGGFGPSPFENWATAFVEGELDLEPRRGVVKCIAADTLTPDDGQHLRQHAKVFHPCLPTIAVLPMPDGPLASSTELAGGRPANDVPCVGWFLELPDGQSLRDAHRDRTTPPATIAHWLSSIAAAAAALHQMGLTHGDIDERWCYPSSNSETSAYLLRNPDLFLSSTRKRETTAGDDLTAIGQLGCRLYLGEPTFSSHASMLEAAVAAGPAGDPLLRVLAFAVKDDPQLRFADATQLSEAFTGAADAISSQSQRVRAEGAKPTTSSKVKKTAAETAPTKPIKSTRRPETNRPAEPRRRPASSSAPKGKPIPTSSERTENSVAPVDRSTETARVSDPRPQPPQPQSTNDSAIAAPTTAMASAEQSPARSVKSSNHRRRPRRNRSAVYVLAGLCIPIILLFLAHFLIDTSPANPVATRIRPPIVVTPIVTPQPVRPNRVEPPPAAPKSQDPKALMEVVVSDDLLWAPPNRMHSGDADSDNVSKRSMTALLPPGPAAIMTWRPEATAALGLQDAFAAESTESLTALDEASGVPRTDIALVSIAMYPGSGGRPSIAMAIHLVEPKPLPDLMTIWEASPARGANGVSLLAGDDVDSLAYYPVSPDAMESGRFTMADGDDSVAAFAVGTIQQISSVAEFGGAPVLLPRLLGELWAATDHRDALTFLVQPNFLVADARNWVGDASPLWAGWLRTNLATDCGGVLMRLVSEDSTNPAACYAEVRLAAAPGVDPVVLKDRIGNELSGAPQIAEEFLLSRQIDVSWRLLASRLPTMWAFLVDQTRQGRFDRQLIWNAYLPPGAVGQISLATLLASNTTATSMAGPSAAASSILSMDEMLSRPMTIQFDQDSLQFAVQAIADQFNDDLPAGNRLPPVTIVGADLQKMGITQNQQIRGFDQRDVPLRRVLTEIVLAANPDRTASGPDDPKQALIWVVAGQGSDDVEIRITTREAAKDVYELPAEFAFESR
ncbi:MAG: hypothetical protein AAGJ40_08895 [Planctomycetota bacterium]